MKYQLASRNAADAPQPAPATTPPIAATTTTSQQVEQQHAGKSEACRARPTMSQREHRKPDRAEQPAP